MIDTHAHLNFSEYENDLGDVLLRMKNAGVSNAVVVGTDIQSSKKAIELAAQYKEIYATIGVYPGDARGSIDHLVGELKLLVSHDKVVAIGEVGLDYKVFDGIEPDHAVQQELFEKCIDVANEHNLPLVVHSRMAEADVVHTLSRIKPRAGAVVHCYSGTYEIAKQALDAGLFISFTGMLTYPKNDELRAVAQQMPHDRIMIETDCPFLPPQGQRGNRNEPMYVREVARVLADLWHKDIQYVDEMTAHTTKQFFRIP